VLVCSDETVRELYGEPVMRSLASAGLGAELHTFPPGDASKCLDQLNRIYRKLGQMGLARDGFLVALGGGVASDLTGFAAATWMRGVPYASCPTTLEADIDASIGGKTGVNHAAGKNMVGAFHHPDLVAVDPECLQTLPARDVSSGLAESLKHALIRDPEFLLWHEQNVADILALEPDKMTELIERNQHIKGQIVQVDEQERTGQRALLNFGHTVGHAIEDWTSYGLRHGEAVALGMMVAVWISQARNLLHETQAHRIESVLQAVNLPVRAPLTLDVDAIVDRTHSDKKVRRGQRRWVLLEDIGRPVIRHDVEDSLVREMVRRLNDTG
jgi:3-dehydroquinate synthase